MPEIVWAQPAPPSIPVEQAERISPWRRRLVEATAIVVGASGLVACTTPEESAPPSYSYDYPGHEESTPLTAAPSSSPPTAPAAPLRTCRPFSDLEATPRQKREAAAGCIDRMENGRAAFITFGPSTKRIEQIAAGLEEHISAVSMNAINLSVDVVSASKETIAAVQKTAKGKCVDTNNSGNLTSVAADNAMPELKKYDFIISATPIPDCNGSFGVAVKGGRHADIFINSIDKAFANDNHPPEKADTVNIVVATHETGHLNMLGHAGEIVALQKNGIQADLITSAPAGKTFDLKRYLQNTRLYAYTSSPDDQRGESDPMGNDNRTAGQACNIVHLDSLTAPRETLYGDAASPSEHVGAQWVTFTAQEAAARQFGRVTLENPIKMKAVDINAEITYNGIAVVPHVDTLGDSRLFGVELYLTNADNDTAALGTLGLLDGASNKTWTIKSGSQNIQIQLDSGQLKVRTI